MKETTYFHLLERAFDRAAIVDWNFLGFVREKKHDYEIAFLLLRTENILKTRRVKIALDRRRDEYGRHNRREVGNVNVMCVNRMI